MPLTTTPRLELSGSEIWLIKGQVRQTLNEYNQMDTWVYIEDKKNTEFRVIRTGT